MGLWPVTWTGNSDESVSFVMPEPALVQGKPTLPAAGWLTGSPASSMIASCQAGGSTIGTYPPPPTIKHSISGHSGNGGHTDWYSWDVNDIDPSTDVDTSGFAGDPAGYGWIETWPYRVNGGATLYRDARALKSVYPYRPLLAKRYVYTADGTEHLYFPQIAHFNHEFVEHLWMDMGYAVNGPFTWIALGIILTMPTADYLHTFLDATNQIPTRVLEVPLPYGDQGYIHPAESPSAAKLTFGHKSGFVSGSFDWTKHPRVNMKHAWLPVPRMFYGIWNPGVSRGSRIGERGRHYDRDELGETATRTGGTSAFLVGRQAGWTSQDKASNIALFEMRFFPDVLATDSLDYQYAQLAQKYSIEKYRT